MKIDIAAHILPQKYVDAVGDKAPGFREPLAEFPALGNVETRLRTMDKYPDLVQVLTVAGPVTAPPGAAGGPTSAELARIVNDALAELVARYPDRFIGAVASLPLDDMDAALKETERAIKDLKLRGVILQASIHSRPIDGPEFMPLYEKMAEYDLPVWIHPWRRPTVPDYAGEETSRYRIAHMWGWPYETTAAMSRLVFSGVLERYPKLKFITHHCGAMVPFFEQRIASVYENASTRGDDKAKFGLPKHFLEYFRLFYGDTALNGSTPGLMCGHAFFGADHLLFGTDMPHDAENGHRAIRETIGSIERMAIPDSEKKKIFEDNARKLLRLPA